MNHRLFSLFGLALLAGAWLAPGPSPAALSFSLDIGSDSVASDFGPNAGGAFDSGNIYLEGQPLLVKDDDGPVGQVSGFPLPMAPEPPANFVPGLMPPPVVQILYSQYFDIDGTDQLGYLLEFQGTPVPLAMPPDAYRVFGILFEPKILCLSYDDDGPAGWTSGNIPTTAGPAHGSAAGADEVIEAVGGFGTWVAQAGIREETLLGLPPPPGPESHDDDVDALDNEEYRFWYLTVDHEATMGLDPGTIYLCDRAAAGPNITPVLAPAVIGVPPGTDIDAFEFVAVSFMTYGMLFGVPPPVPADHLCLLFSVDENDPDNDTAPGTPDESGGLSPATVYISNLAGVAVPVMSFAEDIDGLTCLETSAAEPPESGCFKWYRSPDLENGVDVESWRLVQEDGVVVADDFVSDGRPITGLRWWGSYPGYEATEPGPVQAPGQRPVAFRVSWYSDVPAGGEQPFSMPGDLLDARVLPLAPAGVTNGLYVFERYAASIRDAEVGTWEHEFRYDAAFTNGPWQEKEGRVYWLAVQALFLEDPTNGWGWATTTLRQGWNDDAVRSNMFAPGWVPLEYQMLDRSHPYGSNSVDLAFALKTDVCPRRAKKWAQPPDMKLGENMPSFQIAGEPFYLWSLRADDFVSDGRPITDIHWWGSYLGYLTGEPGPVAPPTNRTARPIGFYLSWHADHPEGEVSPWSQPVDPPLTNVFVPLSRCNEVYYGSVFQGWKVPPSFEHEFQYYVDLLDPNLPLEPWLEESGTVYWLDIQAVFTNRWQPGLDHAGWGWKTTPPENKWNDDSVVRTNILIPPWEPAPYPEGHPIRGFCDLSFELTTDEVGSGSNWWNQPIVLTNILITHVVSDEYAVVSAGDAGAGVQVLQGATNLTTNTIVWASLQTNSLPLPLPWSNTWYQVDTNRFRAYRVRQQ